MTFLAFTATSLSFAFLTFFRTCAMRPRAATFDFDALRVLMRALRFCVVLGLLWAVFACVSSRLVVALLYELVSGLALSHRLRTSLLSL